MAPPSGAAPIVLIGPLAAGKSTVAAVLARIYETNLCSIDDVRWEYLDRLGYDRAEADRRFATGRTPAEKMAYREPFEASVVEQIVAAHSHDILDFGASNSVYEDPALFARVQTALLGAHVVLLLPCEDSMESERLLAARLNTILRRKGEHVSDELLALNAYFLGHPSNRHLATITVYTSKRPPAAIAEEIVRSINAPNMH